MSIGMSYAWFLPRLSSGQENTPPQHSSPIRQHIT